MAINYPSALDGTTQFPQPSGTSLLTSPDHALVHTNISILGTVLENMLGVNPGTNLLRGVSGASDQLFALNTGGTANQTITKGTVNNGIFGTPTITGGQMAGSANLAAGTLSSPQINGTITSAGTVNGLIFGVTIAPGVGTITDSAGGTFTVNAQAANIYYSVQGTAAGNRTINTPANPQPYQLLTYAFKDSGSANGTLIWGTAFRISQDVGTPTIGTGASWNYYGWRYNFIDSKWDFTGQSKNLL